MSKAKKGLKTAIVIVLTVLTVCLCFGITTVNAQTLNTDTASGSVRSADGFDEGYAKTFIEEFLTTYGNRTSGNSGNKTYEEAAGDYLQGKFAELGLEPYFTTTPAGKTNYHQKLEYSINNNQYYSYNIAGIKKSANSTDKTVYIGAYYDNVTNLEDSNGNSVGGDGACSNATGVATLLSVIKNFPDNLNFNVVFVAFAANNVGFKGSEKFVQSLSDSQVAQALLMINLDNIGAGDYTYVYTDENLTPHESFIKGKAEELNFALRSAPSNKKIISGNYYANDLSYTHVGIQSDNVRFRNRGILTANFTSLNWEDDLVMAVQSTTRPQIINTSEDTLKNLQKYYPEYEDVINGVASTVITSLEDGDFVTVMEKSRSEKEDYSIWINKGLVYGICAGLTVIFIGAALGIYYYNKNKAVKKGEKLDINEPKSEPPKAPPTADDVFGMGNGGNNDDNDKHDSVFGDGFD